MTLNKDKSYISNYFHNIFTLSAEPHFLIVSREFHIHVGRTVSICDEAMPYEPFINFYTKMGGGHVGGQLRSKSYSHAVAPLHRRSNL